LTDQFLKVVLMLWCWSAPFEVRDVERLAFVYMLSVGIYAAVVSRASTSAVTGGACRVVLLRRQRIRHARRNVSSPRGLLLVRPNHCGGAW